MKVRYFFLSWQLTDLLQEKHPDANAQDLMKLLGAEWGKVSDEDKTEWNEKASADKERQGSFALLKISNQ